MPSVAITVKLARSFQRRGILIGIGITTFIFGVAYLLDIISR